MYGHASTWQADDAGKRGSAADRLGAAGGLLMAQVAMQKATSPQGGKGQGKGRMEPPPPRAPPKPVQPPVSAPPSEPDQMDLQEVMEQPTEQQAEEKLKGPVLQEDAGYLLAFYLRGTDKEDRVAFTEGAIVRELNQMAAEIEDFPLWLEGGVRLESKFGPATVHSAHTFTMLSKFIHETSNQIVMDIADSRGVAQQICLELKAKKVLFDQLFTSEPASLGPTYIPKAHLLAKGGWMEAKLSDDQMAIGITKNDVAQAVDNMGVTVFRRVHVSGKVEDDSEEGKMLPLGEKFRTHKINMTVKPKEGDMLAFNWAEYPSIPIEKPVIWKGEQQVYKGFIEYTLGGDTITKFDSEGKAHSLICHRTDGCKRLTVACNGSCDKARKASAAFRQQVRTRENTGLEFRQARQEERDARKEHRQNQLKRGIEMLSPKAVEGERSLCELLEAGACKRGARCRFDHSFYGDATAISQIQCQLPKRSNSKFCLLGNRCIYDCSLIFEAGDEREEPQASPASMPKIELRGKGGCREGGQVPKRPG